MSKTFTYTKITSQYYLDYTDEWEQDCVDFDYEVEDEDLLPKLSQILFNYYFRAHKEIFDSEEKEELFKRQLEQLIEENDLIEPLADQYEDNLKDMFEQKAMEWYDD